MDKTIPPIPNADSSQWNSQKSSELYKVNRWGEGYFSVSDGGTLCVLPERDENGPRICIAEVVKEMKQKGITLPAVIRFQDILRSQVKNLNKTFRKAIEKQKYSGQYFGVYPIKVNQIREVVEEIVDAGAPYDYGLEAGSKSELLAILALNKNKHSLNLLNGYKDRECIRLALLGQMIGKKVIIIVEKLSELDLIVDVSREMGVTPMIGLRSKLHAKSGGKWSESSGEKAKFGLSSSEMVQAVSILKTHNLMSSLKLFHFHIGSQIPEIQILRNAIREGIRVYAKLVKMGVDLQYFDIGGGAGLNYDGDFSGESHSVNYNLEEYCNQVVEVVKNVCDMEEIDHPHLVSESGRVITGHHSCVITDVFGAIKPKESRLDTSKKLGEHPSVNQIRSLLDDINLENYHDIYNRASSMKEDALSAFNHGIIDLVERAVIEELFQQVTNKVIETSKEDPHAPQDVLDLEYNLLTQYLCNFSVFQSIPDAWAISQVLPVVPIQRLNEEPTELCQIADLTCDSDGKIKNYIGDEEQRNFVKLHKLNTQNYHLGVFLTGAYQDVMGDMHNLFGRLNEVHVFCDDDDPSDFYIEEYIKGNDAAKVLSILQYNPEYMAFEIKQAIDKQVRRGKIKPRKGVELIDFYESCLNGYTYLK